MRAFNKMQYRRFWIAWLMVVAILPVVGCVSPWWNAFLSPQEVGNFRENRVNEIQRTISFRDKPLGIANAVDPVPEDLVAAVQEYVVGPGDALSIRMLDFLQLGAESEITPLVDELGYIDVPLLGWLHVDGMTPRQLQMKIIDLAKGQGIYPADANPTVMVQFLSRQQRLYNISGAILTPGPYPIVRPDFRLREAINQAGGLDETVRVIYVFRNEPRQQEFKPAGEHRPEPPAPAPAGGETAPVPPITPLSLGDLSTTASPSAPQTAAATVPATSEAATSEQLALPRDEVERDLLEAIAPGRQPTQPTEPSSSESAASPGGPPALPTYIYVNDRFVEAPPATDDAKRETLPATAPIGPDGLTQQQGQPPASQVPATQADVNWEELASEGQQRVIRIPAEKLKHGDPNYNLVIRHQDWVQLDQGQVGVFYLMGHVLRPGVYALSGQEITLTQAIAASGGLDQIAWPTRCEIRRRLEGDREEITQWDLARIIDGRDPDLYIKKEDVVNIGTHAVAPLLATIRNSFRLTYGFGFVYDRNFADIDAVGPQQNPNDRRRAEAIQRGLLP